MRVTSVIRTVDDKSQSVTRSSSPSPSLLSATSSQSIAQPPYFMASLSPFIVESQWQAPGRGGPPAPVPAMLSGVSPGSHGCDWGPDFSLVTGASGFNPRPGGHLPKLVVGKIRTNRGK